MIVKEIMEKQVHKVLSSVSIVDAAKEMTEKKTSYLLVVDDHKLQGIVTENDITRFVSCGEHPKTKSVNDIMVKDVVQISPGKTIEEAAELMTEKSIKKLPVVEDKRLVGMVTAEGMVAAEPKMMKQLGELLLFAKKPQRIAG